MNLVFSEWFFYLPKLTVFLGNRQQSNARAGQKKTHVFFGNARPKSNARAHLKQRKKIVALGNNYTQEKGTWRFSRSPDCLASHACVHFQPR